MTRQDTLALAAAIAGAGIFATAGSLILPVLTLNLEARGYSSIIIGLFGANIGLAAVICTPFVPALVRRFGAGKTMLSGLLTISASNLFYNLFPDSLAAWFIIYFTACAAVGLVFVVAETIITTLAPPARRSFVLGLYATGFSLGFALGPIILRFTGIHGWLPFLVASGLAAAAAALVFAADIKSGAFLAAPGGHFWRMFRAAPLPFVCAFSLGAAEMSVYDLLPVYARKTDYSVEDAVFLLSVFSIGAFLLQPAVGAVADKFNARRTLAAAAVCGMWGAAALPFLIGGGIAAEWNVENLVRMACLGIWGGLLMAVYPLGLAQAARFFPPPKLTAANACFGFAYGGGALFGPAITGVFMDISPHGIAPALALFAALPLFALGGKKTPPAP